MQANSILPISSMDSGEEISENGNNDNFEEDSGEKNNVHN